MAVEPFWKTFSVFQGLRPEDVEHVLSVGRRRRFARGEPLFHEGDAADSVHLIAQGRVAVRVVTYDGKTATLAIRGPGELAGELALLAEETTRTATAVAVEPTETLAIGRTDFAALKADRPRVGEVLIRILATRLRETSSLLVEALLEPAPVRVRRRIADLAVLYRQADGSHAIELSQEDLATLAGTTRAMVNRVLQEERREGRVKVTRGRIVVLCDPDTLRP